MKNIIFSLLFCLCFSCFSQEDSVTISFLKNGRAIDIENKFEIFFVIGNDQQKTTIKPSINKQSFVVPDFCDYPSGHIIFKYKDKFYGLGFNKLKFDQDMKWVIGFDKKPYSKEYHLDSVNDRSTKAIAFLELHPLKKGSGIVTTVSISNLKKYFKESETLVY